MRILKMAWRNLWRNSRRSIITIAAMTLALFVELLYSGLVTGLVMGMEDDATGYDMGDVQVFMKGYLTKPSLYDAVPDDKAIIDEIEAAGYEAAPRLQSGGLAASGEFSAGVAFVGVDPEADKRALDLYEAMAEGKWLDDADPKGVVVGRGLARTLDLKLGSEVIVLSQAADGSMANDLFHVRGILMSVAAATDRSTILMPEETFRELMVFPKGAHKIVVRRPKDVTLEQAKAVVQQIVSAHQPAAAEAGEDTAPTIDVMTWKEINPFIAQYIDSVQGVIVIVYLIVYVAVAILILNAMLMAVFERIREFGVLKAIGYGPGQVLWMMLAEGMLQAVVAMVIGVILALPFGWYLSVYGINVGILGGVEMVGMTMPPIWQAHFSLDTAQIPVVILFFVVFCAVIYPAWKAARISPIEAMHHQ